MDMSNGKLSADFGIASPDQMPPSIFRETTSSPVQGNKRAVDELFERSSVGLDNRERQKL